MYEANKRAGAEGCVIGVSPFEKDCQRMKDLGWADHALQVDATNALALMEAVAKVTDGKMADVVINCVNIPKTEMGSILATRQHGKIYFFSMATSFTAAALGPRAWARMWDDRRQRLCHGTCGVRAGFAA